MGGGEDVSVADERAAAVERHRRDASDVVAQVRKPKSYNTRMHVYFEIEVEKRKPFPIFGNYNALQLQIMSA